MKVDSVTYPGYYLNVSSAKQYSSFKNGVPSRVIAQARLARVLDVFKTDEGIPSYYCHSNCK